MREDLAQWDFVVAAYAVGLAALATLILWSWQSMRRAESRRKEMKRQSAKDRE